MFLKQFNCLIQKYSGYNSEAEGYRRDINWPQAGQREPWSTHADTQTRSFNPTDKAQSKPSAGKYSSQHVTEKS